MQVKVKTYGILKEVFGANSIMIEIKDEGTLNDLIKAISIKYGESYQNKTGRNLIQSLQNRYNLFLNRKKIDLPEELNFKLKDEDEIVILQPVSGG